MVGIVSVLKELTALGVDAEKAQTALPSVALACAEIGARLKNPKCGNDRRVIYAAACLANYRLTLSESAENGCVESFKAGDVTVSQSASKAISAAALLRDEAFAAAAPLLSDAEFIFRQV